MTFIYGFVNAKTDLRDFYCFVANKTNFIQRCHIEQKLLHVAMLPHLQVAVAMLPHLQVATYS